MWQVTHQLTFKFSLNSRNIGAQRKSLRTPQLNEKEVIELLENAHLLTATRVTLHLRV